MATMSSDFRSFMMMVGKQPAAEVEAHPARFSQSDLPNQRISRAYEWIFDVENYFTMGNYENREKLEVLPLYLQVQVKRWFTWVMKRGSFFVWVDFKERMVVRFGKSIEDDPATRLFALRQTGSVSDYVSQFKDLSAQVPGLSDHLLERIFYLG
ncbi:hypothetical protein Bca101_082842 [Brassica carinata]